MFLGSWKQPDARRCKVWVDVRKWNKVKSGATNADVAILMRSSGIIIIQKQKYHPPPDECNWFVVKRF